MSTFEQTVEDKHIGVRIDKVMSHYDPDISRSQAQKLIEQGYILVNGKKTKSNYTCKQNDWLSWSHPEKTEQVIIPEDIPLDIVYEDDVMIVVNKARGMVIHPTPHQVSGTLVNALLYYTTDLANMNSERPGIVHRIDKDTSGLLLVAKTDEALDQFMHAFKNREVIRSYEALVHGELDHEEGIIEAPIGRNPKSRLHMSVHNEGRYAKTHFHVVNRANAYTHVTCQLETGRTHQIRVHMQYIHHPIVHDPIYGNGRDKNPKGQMLFASHLAFQHPVTNEQLEFTLEAPRFFKNEMKRLGFK